jgi:hypothetical protein
MARCWAADARQTAGPAEVPVADVRTLVFTGTLDTRADREQGRAMAARFDDAEFLDIPNGLHTPAYIEPGGCAARILRGSSTPWPSGTPRASTTSRRSRRSERSRCRSTRSPRASGCPATSRAGRTAASRQRWR